MSQPRLGHEHAHPEVIRQQQRGHRLIRREHVARFHAQDFEHAIRRREDFHLAQLCFQFGELGADLGDALRPGAREQQIVPGFGRGNGLFQSLGTGEHPVALRFRDDFLGKEVCRARPISARQFQLRDRALLVHLLEGLDDPVRHRIAVGGRPEGVEADLRVGEVEVVDPPAAR